MGKPKDSKKEKKVKSSKTEKVVKVEKTEDKDDAEFDYDSLLCRANEIAFPMASKDLTKKVLKITKKAAKSKQVRRGVKEVAKALRKNESGIVIIAGDISPLDVICHVPIMCEEKNIPYCYVPSKEQLGAAGNTKRPTSCVLVKTHADYESAYNKLNTEVGALEVPNVA
ncbi:hypothetical protein SARC_10390 [Sphaeroforma arctica JP610]|uniref:H/ACA ribonucleoprotein complex subunit 2 n=1 Tax=Sphaeroforma arctica JP610 TaxID=667725 RepID=A0A0L0FK46_9EUKA|nr:hypothetical protein SARC_10390 [Sphaeroforma arctica JP610]KNC77144.1 hypothetical protein SARC_10390 [Sphaeroforma arctica JP610]|eukprot:XP_014151046.1 hypothetical protein SARC_10390 [Sphaeroforma arctica JP610]